MTTPQTRLGERVPILGRLDGDITVVEPLAVKELGIGGASIETRFPLVLGSLHDMRLTLGAQVVVLKARVVHSHVDEVDQEGVEYRSGVEFVSPPDHVRDAISSYLESLKASRERSG